ncbi:MAG: thrombospondin type 3 repeat-containing protein [Anaerolineales bacterium]|nr:thrombospondin type 3 repeat-containing protein [Anaerolineales bacterium]
MTLRRRIPILLTLLITPLIPSSPGSSVHAQESPQPAMMNISATFGTTVSSTSVCNLCYPPSFAGTIELTVNFVTGSVSGKIEGAGSGTASGTLCDGNGQPMDQTWSISGTSVFDGTVTGSVDPSGAITATATLHLVATPGAVSGADVTFDTPLTGSVSADGSASGDFSWGGPNCTNAGGWSGSATSIEYDRDGDGVFDSSDGCPDIAANTPDGCMPVELDLDQDGVLNEADACPQVPANTPDGCPADRDGDGLADAGDACPDEYARTSDGCPLPIPDADDDGFPDAENACPFESAPNSIDGCPPDQPEEQAAGDLENALAVALLLGDRDGLRQMEGWDDLTPTQQATVFELFDALQDLFDETSADNTGSYDRPAMVESGLPGTEETGATAGNQAASGDTGDIGGSDDDALADRVMQQIQEARNRREQQEGAVVQALADQLHDRQTIIRLINDEKYRQKFGQAYDLYRGTRDLLGPLYERAGEYISWITNPEETARQALQQWQQEKLTEGAQQLLRDEGILYGPEANVMTMEDVAREAYQFIEHASAVPSIVHYGYYRQVYDQAIAENDSPEDAHEWAMSKLSEALKNPPEELLLADGQRPVVQCWTDSYSHDPALLENYNNTFQRLNGVVDPPGVTQ